MKKIILLFGTFLLCTSMLFAQKQISGKVTSKEDGGALPGVTVTLKGTTIGGTITDVGGNYKISVPAGSTTLVFTFIGMKTQEVEIGNQTSVNVVLESSATQLGGVVVTALGIKKDEKAVGYSVQQVKGDIIENGQNTNMINDLGGKVAGVQVTSGSGAAGGSSFITIRGNNSILGDNQPLFVVDGVPIDNSQYASGNPDNGNENNLTTGVAYSNRAIDINPDDIASVTVLKGGAATALYGLRAANGVVVITTKKGSANANGNKVSVSLSSSISFDVVNKLPDLQNTYAQGLNGVWKGPETANRYSWGPAISGLSYGTKGYMTNPSTQDPYGLGNYDWDNNGIIVANGTAHSSGNAVKAYDNVGNFFKTGLTIDNSLSLSGGNKDASYYCSLSNSTQDGIVPNNTFNRTTVKISGDARLAKKVTTSGSINYINSGGDRLQQGSNMSGIMLGLLRTPITFDNSNGSSDPVNTPSAYSFSDGTQRSYRGFGIYDNPYWSVNNNVFHDDVNRIIGMVSATYNPLTWLTITYRAGNDWYIDKRDGHFAVGSADADGLGQVQMDNHYSMDINSDLIANITKDITKDIHSNITIGNNMYQHKHTQEYIEGDGLAQPDFYDISNASTVLSRQWLDRKRTAAFYGDFGFDYKSMIFLNFTGREEWSTTLNDPFFFPSVSGGFVFTELPGLTDNKVLSFGKIRASYAIVANDVPYLYGSTTPYAQAAFADGWTSGISFPFQGLTGYAESSSLGNANLKPEQMKSFEIGTELKFLKNRLGLDFSYYSNTNKDLILEVPIASSTGYSYDLMNAATMTNKGIEVMLDITPVKSKNWQWDMNFNFTKNKNMVVSLAPGIDNVFLGGFTGAEIRAVAGEPYGSMYGNGWLTDGNGKVVIDDQPSSPTYKQPIADPNEKSAGTTQPKWLLGISNSVKYKNISLSFMFDIKVGGIMWDGTKGALCAMGRAGQTGTRGDSILYDGVMGHVDATTGKIVESGTNTLYTVRDQAWYLGNGGGFGSQSAQFIENANWVRLKELTLTYSLSANICKKIGFTNVAIFFTGRNLWLSTPYTGVDPETSLTGADNAQGIDYFNMPNTKSYIFGLKLSL